jgi:hypothetical protein
VAEGGSVLQFVACYIGDTIAGGNKKERNQDIV